jgi:phospholipid-binding lipoprotein MlaA
VNLAGRFSRLARMALAMLALVLASGCATTGGDPRDPFEGFNRAMYGVNEGIDEVIAKPIASAYRDLVPDPVRTWVRNFFANIEDVFIGVNNLLQAKPVDAVNDWARFGFNSVFGIFGINDVASEMGLEKHNEDFGQTLGRWGMDGGPYLVWPILGSSNFRDSAGRVLDIYVDPVRRFDRVMSHGRRNSVILLRATSQRADLLDASRVLEEAALDKYVFQRDAYLQRRRNLIYDGNPPRDGSSRREVPAAEAPGQAVVAGPGRGEQDAQTSR